MKTIELPGPTIENLQSLVRINFDSARGCMEAATAVAHDGIANLLRRLGSERSRHAQALERLIRLAGDQPEQEGSVAGSAHRYWLDLRAALNGGDPYVVLLEAARGDERLERAYETTLATTAGTPAQAVVEDQLERMRSGAEAIRHLRETHAA